MATKQPFTRMWNLPDQLEGTEGATVILRIRRDRLEPGEDRSLHISPLRTLRALEDFTVHDEKYAYFVATGDDVAWLRYGSDLVNRVGLWNIRYQVISLDGETVPPRIHRELLHFFAPLDRKITPLVDAIKKTPFPAAWKPKLERWRLQFARALQRLRMKPVTISPELRTRVEASLKPFGYYEAKPTTEMTKVLTLLGQYNPGYNPRRDGDLAEMVVNILDELRPDAHVENARRVAATGVSSADVKNIEQASAQLRVWNAFKLIADDLQDEERWIARPPNAFDTYLIKSVKAELWDHRMSELYDRPRLVKADQWLKRRLGHHVFESDFGLRMMILSDEQMGKRWAVLQEPTNFVNYRSAEILKQKLGEDVPARARPSFDRLDAGELPVADARKLRGRRGFNWLRRMHDHGDVVRLSNGSTEVWVVPLDLEIEGWSRGGGVLELEAL